MKRLLFGVAAAWALATNTAAMTADQSARLAAAAQVIRAITPTIPTDYWRRARCVVVVPDVKKTAFVVGGEYGKGAMSCRSGAAWSAPVFLQLAKGSWGVQMGAEQIDVVMLVMNEEGVQKLLDNNVTLGLNASIAAGPIGRQAEAGTDADLKAEILAYSRAQGLFAGVNMSGGILRPDSAANRAVYGSKATTRTILASRAISAPTEAAAFLTALNGLADEAADRPVKTSGTVAQSTPPKAATTVNPTPDSDLRTRILAIEQRLDRLLADSPPVAPAGGNTPAAVAVERAKLTELRSELEALLAALNKR